MCSTHISPNNLVANVLRGTKLLDMFIISSFILHQMPKHGLVDQLINKHF